MTRRQPTMPHRRAAPAPSEPRGPIATGASGEPGSGEHTDPRYAKVICDLIAAALEDAGSHPTAAKRIKKAIARHKGWILRCLPDWFLEPPSDADHRVARTLDTLVTALQSAREQLDMLIFERRQAKVRDVPGSLLGKQEFLRDIANLEDRARKLRSGIEHPLEELGPLEWDVEEFDPAKYGPPDPADPSEVRRTKASKLIISDFAIRWLAECWKLVTGEYPHMSVSDESKDEGPFAEWVMQTLLDRAPALHQQVLRSVAPVRQSLRRLREQGALPRP